MRTLPRLLMPILLLLLAALPVGRAELVSDREALTVAENWIRVIIQKKGDWGGNPTATVTGQDALTREGRVVGHLFYVEPQGFILTSTCRELTPVKAYSARSTLEPLCAGGLTDLLGLRMKQAIDLLERETGLPVVELGRADVQRLLPVDYSAAWRTLADPNCDVGVISRATRSDKGMDYEEGEIQINTNWHQKPPYNDQCPDLGCDWSGWPYYSYNTNALVGCVATAGIQVMRYWSWPPCDSTGSYVDRYRWSYMPDDADIYSPQDQIDCVAAAGVAIANAVGMDFGCSASGAQTYDMDDVYENRRYDTILGWYREDFAADTWFDMLKDEFNHNRVVQYRVEEHSIVGDGWQEIDLGGGTVLKQYHMNYGWWGTADDTWYELDHLNLGGIYEEYYLYNIRPIIMIPFTAVGYFDASGMGGAHYDKPRRYFVLDTTVAGATFEAGQCLQYLRPDFWLRASGSASQFHGAPGAPTEFHHDAPVGDVRIRILDGTLRMHSGGEIVFH